MSTRTGLPVLIPAARGAKPTPIRPRQPATNPARKQPPPPPPPTLAVQATAAERRDVKRLITALEVEGVADAEALVRRDRDGLIPGVATALSARRLAAVVDDAPAVVRRVTEILASEGTRAKGSLPGWSLVEI